jgi:hypothetical protein
MRTDQSPQGDAVGSERSAEASRPRAAGQWHSEHRCGVIAMTGLLEAQDMFPAAGLVLALRCRNRAGRHGSSATPIIRHCVGSTPPARWPQRSDHGVGYLQFPKVEPAQHVRRGTVGMLVLQQPSRKSFDGRLILWCLALSLPPALHPLDVQPRRCHIPQQLTAAHPPEQARHGPSRTPRLAERLRGNEIELFPHQ